MKFSKIVNIIDVESTCWEPKNSQPVHEIQEIIEIGIATINISSLEMLDNQSILVKPQTSKVSKFCTELTTLTQAQVDTGISFQEACQILQSKFKSNERTMISWGDFDRKIFQDNSRFYNVSYPFGPRHMNLKNTFTILHGLEKEVGLDKAVALLNFPFEGTHHRGDADAKNISNIFIHTLKKFRGIR